MALDEAFEAIVGRVVREELQAAQINDKLLTGG